MAHERQRDADHWRQAHHHHQVDADVEKCRHHHPRRAPDRFSRLLAAGDAKAPAELIGVYGICSLLVAILGVYAGLAYSVVERTKEFALRVALGAERQRIFSMVLNESGRIALGGIVVGAIGAFFAVRVIKSLLYGVSPFDPLSAAAAVLLLAVAAGFAAWLPARRAASIEPMQALRGE